jgi:hypothetical protein
MVEQIVTSRGESECVALAWQHDPFLERKMEIRNVGSSPDVLACVALEVEGWGLEPDVLNQSRIVPPPE